MAKVVNIRKKPVEIQAIQNTGDNEAEIRAFLQDDKLMRFTNQGVLQIYNVPEMSWITCPTWHFILKGIKGEFYPCDPEILERTYDILE